MRLSAEVAEQNDREFIVGPSRATREIIDLVQQDREALGHRADPRRERHRQGAARAADPSRVGRSGERRSSRSTWPPFRRSWSKARSSATRRARSPAPSASSSASSSWRAAARCSSTRSATCAIELQAKLLRAIQESEIERVGGTHPIKTDFRLIAATNVDLDKAVKEGTFREDLYYRLNVIPIRMPALRDRIEDLPELARFFLRRYNQKFRKNIQGIADSTLRILGSYWWPGNIRELENLIERLVAVSDKDWITDEDLPYELHVAQLDAEGPPTENLLERAVSTFERNFLIRALEKSRLERHRDRASARHSAQHAEVQDGPARDPRARARRSAATNSPQTASSDCPWPAKNLAARHRLVFRQEIAAQRRVRTIGAQCVGRADVNGTTCEPLAESRDSLRKFLDLSVQAHASANAGMRVALSTRNEPR